MYGVPIPGTSDLKFFPCSMQPCTDCDPKLHDLLATRHNTSLTEYISTQAEKSSDCLTIDDGETTGIASSDDEDVPSASDDPDWTETSHQTETNATTQPAGSKRVRFATTDSEDSSIPSISDPDDDDFIPPGKGEKQIRRGGRAGRGPAKRARRT